MTFVYLQFLRREHIQVITNSANPPLSPPVPEMIWPEVCISKVRDRRTDTVRAIDMLVNAKITFVLLSVRLEVRVFILNRLLAESVVRPWFVVDIFCSYRPHTTFTYNLRLGRLSVYCIYCQLSIAVLTLSNHKAVRRFLWLRQLNIIWHLKVHH